VRINEVYLASHIVLFLHASLDGGVNPRIGFFGAGLRVFAKGCGRAKIHAFCGRFAEAFSFVFRPLFRSLFGPFVRSSRVTRTASLCADFSQHFPLNFLITRT
jgi:hypothetical protein